MFLTAHVVVGAVLVEKLGIESNALAFTLGFVSHFFVDMIPHGDEKLGGEFAARHYFLALLPWVVGDFLLLGLVASGIFLSNPALFRLPIIIAMTASTLPDALQVFHYAIHPIPRYMAFHHGMHGALKKKIGLGPGIAVQSLFLAACIALLLA